MGAGDAIGLTFGGLDDQEDAPLSARAWSSLKVKVSPWHMMVAEDGFSTPSSVGGVVSGWPPQATIQ